MSIENWARLQRVALSDLHQEWLNGMDAALLEQAQRAPTARRWLANRLATEVALFREPMRTKPSQESDIEAADWLWRQWSAEDLALCCLGALTHLKAMRRVVSREGVLQLQRVLGKDLYRELLAWDGITGDSSEGLPNRPRDDALLKLALARSAAGQVHRLGMAMHPMVGERIMLAFPRSWVDCEQLADRPETAKPAVLTQQTVTQVFAMVDKVGSGMTSGRGSQ